MLHGSALGCELRSGAGKHGAGLHKACGLAVGVVCVLNCGL
jgi:hypothetical protein